MYFDDGMEGLKLQEITLLKFDFFSILKVCMVTELAEGDLFQIIEDDATLPEPEVGYNY